MDEQVSLEAIKKPFHYLYIFLNIQNIKVFRALVFKILFQLSVTLFVSKGTVFIFTLFVSMLFG